jgi:hypothetical protein
MSVTNSSLLGMFGTTLMITAFYHCAMCDTNSSCSGLVVTSLVAAVFPFYHCTMCDANSNLSINVVTSLVAANIDISLYAMRDTNSSLLCLIVTSLKAASLPPLLHASNKLLQFWLDWCIPRGYIVFSPSSMYYCTTHVIVGR